MNSHPFNLAHRRPVRPGHLRNPALASHAFHILPYYGLGSGIPRALEAWPQLEFVDDRRGNQLRVTISRAEAQLAGVTEGVTEGVNGLLEHIQRHSGLRVPALSSVLNTSPKNVERWLKQLREAGRIEFVGSPKTGGYHAKAAT